MAGPAVLIRTRNMADRTDSITFELDSGDGGEGATADGQTFGATNEHPGGGLCADPERVISSKTAFGTPGEKTAARRKEMTWLENGGA